MNFLEQQSIARAGEIGEYLLATDADGKLFVVIAGHTFIGDGSLKLG